MYGIKLHILQVHSLSEYNRDSHLCRKRQQADVAHVWEDFLESQALEKSVLSDMTDCLHSRCREEDS